MVSKDYSDSAIVYVLPAQLYGQANEMLTAARESGRRLETACDLLKEKLIALATETRKANLVDGHRYGYIFLSCDATAARGRKMIPHHGEIYIGVATYRLHNSGIGALMGTNCWGVDYTVQVPEGMLLLELP